MLDWKQVEAFAACQAAKVDIPHFEWPTSPQSRRFQIMSDLHLELGQQYYLYDFPVTGSVLILAGNIGRLVDYEHYLYFLQVQAKRYDKVLLVLGNQEFYDLSYDEGIDAAKRLTSDKRLAGKVQLLHRSVYVDSYYSTIVFGCTLWSHIPHASREWVGWKISDYHKIRDWSVEANNAVHQQESWWLRDSMRRLCENYCDTKRNLLVVTHHAPRVEGTSASGYAGNPWASVFASDVLSTMRLERIKTWVFGHTEYTTDFMVGGMQLVSNQRGFVRPGVERKAKAQASWVAAWISIGSRFDPKRTIQGPPRSAVLAALGL